MPGIDIAFYTVGDTRDPNVLPLGAPRRDARPGRSREVEQPRVPFATVSDVYRSYCRALVGRHGAVFGVASSREAKQSIESWASGHPHDHLRNLYFVGHGNRAFAWAARVNSVTPAMHV
jgi:hypothetical protein